MTCGEVARRPVGAEPAEVEGLVQLVGPDELRHRLRGLGPGLGDADPLAPRVAVLLEHAAPSAVDVVHLRLLPHRLVAEHPLDHRARSGSRPSPTGSGRAGSPPCRARARRRPGSRRRRGRARTGAPPRTCRPPQGCASRGRAGRGRRDAGTTGQACRRHPSPGSTPGRRRSTASCWAAGCRHGPCRRGTGSGRAPASPAERPAPPGTTGAGRRCGWAPGRRSPAGRARARGRAARRHRSASRTAGRCRCSRLDVVAVVLLGREVERRDPERVDAEVAQVGQPGRDAGEVPDAVTVGVGEAADVDLVDDGFRPPAS